jgi:hypothetical protein
MAGKVIFGSGPVTLVTRVPACLARRHWGRCRLRRSPPSSSTFLRSLRSRPVTALPRYYGRSDSCALRRGSAWVSSQRPPERLLLAQVSLIHALGLPTILSPNTCGCSASSSRGTLPHQRVGPRPLPHGSSPNGNSGLRLYYAGSPHLAGRIEFRFLPPSGDFLRTGRSPPAAPHPVLRRRSCSRLQVTLTWRGLSSLRPSALSGARRGGFTPPSARFAGGHTPPFGPPFRLADKIAATESNCPCRSLPLTLTRILREHAPQRPFQIGGAIVGRNHHRPKGPWARSSRGSDRG